MNASTLRVVVIGLMFALILTIISIAVLVAMGLQAPDVLEQLSVAIVTGLIGLLVNIRDTPTIQENVRSTPPLVGPGA